MSLTELTDAEARLAVQAIDVLLSNYSKIVNPVAGAKSKVDELKRLRDKLLLLDTNVRAWRDKTGEAGSCMACNQRDDIWIIQVGRSATVEIRVCEQHRQVLLKSLEVDDA